MTAPPPPSVFLSYSRTDVFFVRDLAHGLELAGITVWLDARQILAGDDYLAATEQGIRECTHLVVVASRYSMASAEVQREIELAVRHGRKICPVLLQDATLPAPLRALHWIDFRFHFEQPLAQLARGLRQGSFAAAAWDGSVNVRAIHTGGFQPLANINAPVPVLVLSGLLLMAVFLQASASLAFVDAGLGVMCVLYGVLACLHGRTAFLTAHRRVGRPELWQTLAVAGLYGGALCVPAVWRLLEITSRGPRTLGWLSEACVVVGAALLVRSAAVRRWLPARPEPVPFWPTWLRRNSAPPNLN